MMVKIATSRNNGAAGAQLNKLLRNIEQKQRQIRDTLRRTRDEYWIQVADQLQKANDDKDMKLYYYKLIKEAHGPQMAGTTKGRQSLSGKHMKQKEGNERTRTQGELTARWIEHFTDLFNQPGEVGNNIDKCLPAQRPIHGKIRTGKFDMDELQAAIRDMNNDKAARLDGYGIEMEKYIAGEVYLQTALELYNVILQRGDMPAVFRDVIITVLYKGKGSRDNCDSYR